MFSKILVPIDLRHESSWKKALPVAVAEARQHGARLTLLNILPDVRPVDPARDVDTENADRLAALAKEAAGDGVDCEVRIEHFDSVHRGIRRIVSQEGFDLVVMSSHNPEFSDLLLGSNATQVVHHTDCSVFIVR